VAKPTSGNERRECAPSRPGSLSHLVPRLEPLRAPALVCATPSFDLNVLHSIVVSEADEGRWPVLRDVESAKNEA